MGKIEIVQDCTFQDLDVTGNINVSGTVDGVDVSAHVEDTSVHHTHANKTNLDALNQNVGTTGLPAFNGLTVNGDLTVTGRVTGAGYNPPNQSFLDAINQNLGTANAPAFAGITVNGDVAVTGKVDGVDVSAHAADNIIHHAHANKANIDTLNQNLGTVNTPVFAGLTINGDIAATGKVDGVDVSAHAANTSIHYAHPNQANLDAVNQNLGSANAPSFAALTINGDVAVTGKVNGVDVSAHATRHQAGGADALTGNLDANARVQVMVSNRVVGTRRAFNLLSGNNVILAVVDNATNESVDVTISAVGGGGPVTGPEIVTGLAGEALSAYALCYRKSDGKYYRANASSVATMPGVILAAAAFSAGQSGSFIRRGQVTNSSWAWATVGGFVYADVTGGSMTQTIPTSSGNQVQIVGIANTSTEIDFDPQLVLIEVA